MAENTENLTKVNSRPENPRDIQSTVLLKVKSHTPGGSGQIIGVNEFPFRDGIAEISQIQFSDPGEYVISVIPSSEFLNPTEFTITVKPEEEVIPQDSKEEVEPVDGSRPIITQIDQPGIVLKPMNFNSSPSDATQISTNLGFIPFVWYNGVAIEKESIRSLELYNDELIPKMKITFVDKSGILGSPEGRSLSDTKIELFLNSGSDILKSIHLRFKIQKQKDVGGGMEILGILDLDNFYRVDQKSYNGTSFDVLRQISREHYLGFNSNITNTQDSMIWRRNSIETDEFIRSIVKHSYISDDSFVTGYIDYYWCFNYVDVEKEWNRDITNDVGLNSQGVQTLEKGTKSDILTKMQLTNDKSANDSSFYFESYELKNNATSKLINEGTYTVSKVYDRVKKQFLKFDIDSLTSKGDDKVILKGAPGDKKEMSNYRTEYSGKIDTDNVHNNYHYAVSQNQRNFTNLTNVVADLVLPQPNYNLYRYLKIKVNFINQKQTETNKELYDLRLSGEWTIMDIRFIWDGFKLKQKIRIARKEFGKTVNELNNQVTKNEDTTNSEINENPTDLIEKPNEKYKVGEVYTVRGSKDNKVYQITIERLSENGNEVVARLVEL